MRAALLSVLLVCVGACDRPARAQSPEFMMEDCRNLSRLFFQSFNAQSDVKYEGQREDGSHFVNGTIFISDTAEFFQCSYAESRRQLVDFWAKERSWPEFVAGGDGPNASD